MRACVRASFFSPRDLWACVRRTRDRPKNRSCSVFGSSHLNEDAEFVALLADLERRGDGLRLREPSPPRRGFNDFVPLQLLSFLCRSFFWVLQVFFFFHLNLFPPPQTPAGAAGVAGRGGSWWPSLEAGYPGTDTQPQERSDSHHARPTERYF